MMKMTRNFSERKQWRPKQPCSIHSKLKIEIEKFDFDEQKHKRLAGAILTGSDIDTSDLPGYGPFPFFPIEFFKKIKGSRLSLQAFRSR